MKTILLLCFLFFTVTGCKKNDLPPAVPNSNMYFPPLSGTSWEAISVASLGWNEGAVQDLYAYLELKKTKGFIILKNGRIVVEKYFGSFNSESNWYWASAGKTMTALLVGLAQEEGKLQLGDPTSKYLGTGWSSLPPDKESAITVRHQLSMTTGLDDGISPDSDCTLPSCLLFKAEAGSRWAYHNAPYTLLTKVVEAATSSTYNAYFKKKIGDVIGMNSVWIQSGYNNVHYSTTRSATRFGLLLLNRGTWDGMKLLKDDAFFTSQTNSSQSLNPSYGYLTWLNGKAGYMLPSLQTRFPGALMPQAPADLYAALGKNDQKIYVVPSQQLVVVRFGEAADNGMLAVSSFDNELWGKLKTVIGY